MTSIKKRKEWDQLHASHRDMLAREFIGVARLSVQREAEAYGDALRYRGWSNYQIKPKLQLLGFVPENEPDQEAGKV